MLVKPAQRRSKFFLSVITHTVGNPDQRQRFRYQGAHHENKERIFPEYIEEAAPGTLPVPELDELNEGGKYHNGETRGIEHVRAGPYLFIDGKFESPGHAGQPEYHARYEEIGHHRFGFSLEPDVLSREKPEDDLGNRRQGAGDPFGVESDAFAVVEVLIAEQCAVEMRSPEAFERIGIDTAVGRGISAKAGNDPVGEQQHHREIGGAAGFEKIERQRCQGIGDTDALQHAENAEVFE